MKIATGAAKGEGNSPKLSDFGLAKLGPTRDKSHVSTRVMGTYGYCAPEYAMTGPVNSFGVVFLELITGCKTIDNTQPHEKSSKEPLKRLLAREVKLRNTYDGRDSSEKAHYYEQTAQTNICHGSF
ncbi:hypothetical protein Fot_29500 [Forsythia ovata]|uniref:Protein kinase domain-containing protein n=1 Tax=Forsythia ovata TaxID=205694 RepID=A0ABD1TS18_9LAMI